MTSTSSLSELQHETTGAVEQTPLIVLLKSLRRAYDGGLAGSMAMTIQVVLLMWIRTAINYQYRHGTGTWESFRLLYAEGGVPRFYRGLLPAILPGPLSRFGYTDANTGTLELMTALSLTKRLPTAVKTAAASVAAGLFRILLMPIDTLKTTMYDYSAHHPELPLL